MRYDGPRATILYWDDDHRRRQVTIPTTGRDNIHLDILDYDRIHGTDLYDAIKPRRIRKVVHIKGRQGGRT